MMDIVELGDALYPCFIGQIRYQTEGVRWVAVALPDTSSASLTTLHAWYDRVIDGDDYEQEEFISRSNVATGNSPIEALKNLYCKTLEVIE